jgi:uncharacterized protein
VYHPAFADEVPYNICLVELDEGIRMYSTVEGASAAELRVGMRLLVTFDALVAEITLPRFVPAGPSAVSAGCSRNTAARCA